MAKLTFILDKKSVDSFGRSQIKIRIVAGDSNTSIRTGMYVPEKVFVGNPDAVVARTYASARTINKEMAELYYQYHNVLMEIDKRGLLQHMSAAEIRDYARRQKEYHVERTFTSTLQEYTESCRTEKTRGTYNYAAQLMERFYGKNKFLFEEINYKFLTDFERWMEQKGIGMASRSIIFRNIRTVYNYAIRNEWVSQDMYPFKRFKIKQPTKKVIEYVPEKTMRKLLSLNLTKEECADGIALARDVFLLSFFLCGINPIDLYNLPLSNGKISFVRQKVQWHEPEPIQISIQPVAQSIIDKYRGTTHLLCFHEKYSSFESFYHFVKHRLKKLGKLIDCEDITLYWARYSWATYASKIDVSDSVIGKALGHASSSLAERRYISFDWAKVDKANVRVIEYAFRKRVVLR